MRWFVWSILLFVSSILWSSLAMSVLISFKSHTMCGGRGRGRLQ
jgi:hypothetical protein